jgi:energy-coupling factor transporter ATP-binding protein EcfA2
MDADLKRGLTMQLSRFEVNGLFGCHKHVITFAKPNLEAPSPSLIILHGRNGVGKTTILRMISGLLSLDFNIFRKVPFAHCELRFDTDDLIVVQAEGAEPIQGLNVSFSDLSVQLHPGKPGAIGEDQVPQVEQFRERFFAATENLNFDFIDTARIMGLLHPQDEMVEFVFSPEQMVTSSSEVRIMRSLKGKNPKARLPDKQIDLAAKVQKFIQEAQINYRRFFATDDPDLFPKIINRLTSDKPKRANGEELLNRLQKIRKEDADSIRFGLEPDHWDYDQLAVFLQEKRSEPGIDYALTVLSAYVEALESRAAERQLVARRLRTFESLIADFFEDKKVLINPKQGFEIVTSTDKRLREDQLSSGEYHLLYLMVCALVTQRRGTVIAIDEPEMSMHLSWQRKLIGALIECASNAEPQFIFATHSPDIAAEYSEHLVPLGKAECQ